MQRATLASISASSWFWLAALIAAAVIMEVTAVRERDAGIAISGLGIAILAAFAFQCPLPANGDVRAIFHDGKCKARVDTPAIDQHRAGAALAVIAALFRAGQVEMFAQGVEQGGPGAELKLVALPIHS